MRKHVARNLWQAIDGARKAQVAVSAVFSFGAVWGALKLGLGVPDWLLATMVFGPLLSGFFSAPVWRRFFVGRYGLSADTARAVKRAGGTGFFASEQRFLEELDAQKLLIENDPARAVDVKSDYLKR